MGRSKDFNEDEVLNKAVNLFWNKGYNATSMQDIVDSLGISRSSLYDTYGDKHALFIKALESYRCSVFSKICEIESAKTPARQMIKAFLDQIPQKLTLTCDKPKGCFYTNAAIETAPEDSAVNSIVDDINKRTEDFFYDAIVAGQHVNEIAKNKKPRAIARFLMNTLKGMNVSAKLETDSNVFDDIISVALSVLD